MILTGPGLCIPSRATVQELFSVARDAGIIPDISMDPILTSFLSLDSAAVLQHRYASLQRSMSGEQQSAFGLSLSEKLGGRRVTHGRVGIVALALSMLFDQVAQQIRAQGPPEGAITGLRAEAQNIFGISSSSRIGLFVHSYLAVVPGIANNLVGMAETTELFDNLLKLELLDHYERMTTKKRMSSVSMQQWLVGAAFHLHVRIHQVRLNSVPRGSVESLRRAYKSKFDCLVQDYTTYLRRNIQETAAAGPKKTQTDSAQQQTDTPTNLTCKYNVVFNDSLAEPVTSSDSSNQTATANRIINARIIWKTEESRTDFKCVENQVSSSAGNKGDEDVGVPGMLVIEPLRNVSHNVRHHPCQSPAIQEALVTHIMNAQDLESNRNFFQYPEKVFHGLLRQRGHFEL